MPRTTLYASQMSKLAELACGIDALLQTSSPQHVHEADVREGETLIRRVAQLKRDFAQPQARPLQRFLEASRLDEVLGMVRDVNTAQAFANNISSIVRVQRMMHLVEFFLVSVYAVELFHALAEGFRPPRPRRRLDDLPRGGRLRWLPLRSPGEEAGARGRCARPRAGEGGTATCCLYFIIMGLLLLVITAAMSRALYMEERTQTSASKSELPPPQQHFIFTLFMNYFCTPAPPHPRSSTAERTQPEQTPKPRPAAPTEDPPHRRARRPRAEPPGNVGASLSDCGCSVEALRPGQSHDHTGPPQDAEEKRHPFGVPGVEVPGLGEVGVAADIDAAEPGARPTSYEFALYEVALNSESALAKVAANPDNRWVTEAEILSGWCNDGTRVSPTMMRIVMMLSNERA